MIQGYAQFWFFREAFMISLFISCFIRIILPFFLFTTFGFLNKNIQTVWLENFHLVVRFVWSFWVQRKFCAKLAKKHRMIFLTWKFPFRVLKMVLISSLRFLFAHFEYKLSFGQIWVKITKWSIWYENLKFGYLKGARF